MNCNPFHLAIQVRNLKEARDFYGELLACPEGRSSDTWIDFNLYGHQLVCHLNPNIGENNKIESHYNPVDGHGVPVPHFGVVLNMDDWHSLAGKMKASNVEFVIEPYVRFEGQTGEQATMFFMDPSGNALEFKAFKNIETELFTK